MAGISTYRRYKRKNGGLMYTGYICNVDVVKVKITDGPWVEVVDLGRGKYEVVTLDADEHGDCTAMEAISRDTA